MLGKLSVALLLMASPALTNEPAADASAPEYKVKKVCHTVEVAGSFIPRTSCVTKKIPIKKPDAESQEAAKVDGTTAESSGQEHKEQ